MGVFVGGGVSVGVQDEVERAVGEHRERGGYGVKFVRMEVGLRDRLGWEGADGWVREELGRVFGVDVGKGGSGE